MLATFLSQVVNGLIFGSLIGLIALGYTMVYGIIQLINFAHGEVFMVGAYGGLVMFTYLLPTFIQQQWYLALPLLLVGERRSPRWSRCSWSASPTVRCAAPPGSLR